MRDLEGYSSEAEPSRYFMRAFGNFEVVGKDRSNGRWRKRLQCSSEDDARKWIQKSLTKCAEVVIYRHRLRPLEPVEVARYETENGQ